MPGILVGEHYINNYHYYDDNILKATCQKALRKMIDTVDVGSEKQPWLLYGRQM